MWNTSQRPVGFFPVFWGMCIAVALVACSPRQTALPGDPVPDSTVEQVYVATERDLTDIGPTFGQPRNPGLRYFRAAVSIPPTHKPGQIEWPDGPVDAATDFVVAETQVFRNGAQFTSAVRTDRKGNEILLFVPGYNNTLSESMYRLAQMQIDFNVTNPAVLFAWPSAGDPRGYIYDRDSVLYARDDLEGLMNRLVSHPDDRIVLLAHSMGSQLVMEVMRQAAMKGNRRLLSRINSVVLMSPDIDPDVFRSQADAIGDLPQPFLIFVSRQDRALSLASFISGRKPRLGVIDGPEAVEGLGVKVIDFTELGDGEGLNHAVPTTSPAAISVLTGMIAQAGSPDAAFNDYMVLTQQP